MSGDKKKSDNASKGKEKKDQGVHSMNPLDSIITDSGGRLAKMEVDYSTTCDEKIPEAQAKAKSGKVQEAVDMLMTLEKQTRTVSMNYSYILMWLNMPFYFLGS